MNQQTKNEILKQWEGVKADRAYCRDCLENTGPGESPYTRAQEEAWAMREHCLMRTLLAAMPEIEALLSPNETQNARDDRQLPGQNATETKKDRSG